MYRTPQKNICDGVTTTRSRVARERYVPLGIEIVGPAQDVRNSKHREHPAFAVSPIPRSTLSMSHWTFSVLLQLRADEWIVAQPFEVPRKLIQLRSVDRLFIARERIDVLGKQAKCVQTAEGGRRCAARIVAQIRIL